MSATDCRELVAAPVPLFTERANGRSGVFQDTCVAYGLDRSSLVHLFPTDAGRAAQVSTLKQMRGPIAPAKLARAIPPARTQWVLEEGPTLFPEGGGADALQPDGVELDNASPHRSALRPAHRRMRRSKPAGEGTPRSSSNGHSARPRSERMGIGHSFQAPKYRTSFNAS